MGSKWPKVGRKKTGPLYGTTLPNVMLPTRNAISFYPSQCSKANQRCTVGAASPRTLSSNNILPDKCQTTKQASKFNYIRTPKISFSHQELEVKENPASFGRREAIGCGFLLGLANVLLQPPPAAAEATPCEFTIAPSGLAFCDKVVGSGPEAEKGQLIKAHYVGKLESGKVFDSSYNRGKPLTFRVGVGEVIKGWDEGIVGGDGVPAMLAGGKRVLKLPPELGYGARGAGCRGGSCIIPPNSVLLFDVEFIGKA